MTQTRFKSEHKFSLLVAAASILIVLPIVYFGIPDTIDLPQHYRFAQVYYDSIVNGDLFPGWAGNQNHGYGDIGIRFYPPLAYYILAFTRILVGNWYDASWITFVFWMVTGTFGIYRWARCWFTTKESSIIAGIYLLIPFHLHQLYTGFNQFSEFAAASILTFCFAFLTRIFQHGKIRDIIGLSVFYSLLILTHLPSAIVGSFCLFLYFLTFLKKNELLQPFLKSATAVTLAMAATSFYWIRLITEIQWLNHETERFSTGYFGFASNFFPSSYFFDGGVLLSRLIVDLTTVFTMIFFVSAFFYLGYRNKKSRGLDCTKSIFKTVLPVGVFAFLMYTPISKPIWVLISPLQKIQFPIRWMPVAAMCGAMICGATVNYLIKKNCFQKRIYFYPFLAVASLVLVFNFVYLLHPTSYVPIERQKFETLVKKLPSEQSFSCWWTIWSKPEAFELKDKVLTKNRQINIIDWKSEEKIFEVFEGNASIARIAIFAYPHWKATVNGLSVPTEKDENGALLVPIPAERSLVKISFVEPQVNRIGEFLSIAAWILLFGLFVFPQITFRELVNRKRLS